MSELFAPYKIETYDCAILLIYRFQAIHSFSECLAFDSRIYPASIYREVNSLKTIKYKIQSSLDTDESIADLAWMLDQVENSEDLAELQAVPEFTHNRLNLAARRLPSEQQQRLRRWAMENKQRRSTA